MTNQTLLYVIRFDLPALVQVVQQVVCTSSCPNEKPSGRERDISRLLELLMGSMWFLLHPESPELQYSTDQQLSISHKHQWSLVVQTAEFTGTRKKCAYVATLFMLHLLIRIQRTTDSLSNQNQ